MRTRSLFQLTAATALALTSLAAAACSSAPTRAAPLPAPGTAAPSPAAPSTAASADQPGRPINRPTTVRPTTTEPRCLGAVTHTIDVAKAGPPWRKLCIAVGGVVWLKNLGPDSLSVHPAGNVDCWYEAGVYVCRLIRTGTVRFTVTTSQETRPLTVVVTKASTPAKPSPACSGVVTLTLDGRGDTLPWSALCVRKGSTLRLEHLGDIPLSWEPWDNVSCADKAGVRECRLVRTGTVTFTFSDPQHQRQLIVVVIK